MGTAQPNWDLDQYILNYRGHGQIHRLRFIASKCPPLQSDALQYAIRLLKETTLDASLYQETVEMLQQVLTSVQGATLDRAWMENTSRTAKATTERLEAELKNYKNNLIKESIRMGHMDLAEHYYRCGDYDNALKCYARIRDYCTSPKHLLDQCMDAVNVGFQMRNYSTVQAYISKAQNAPDSGEKTALGSKLKAASALYSLATGKYLAAANEFLQIGPDLGSSYNEVVSANDIAIYGGLCSMAFFDREDLKSRFLENSEFKMYLELEPHIREAAYAFVSAHYSVTLGILERHRSDFVVDIFLSPHVELLYKEIRQKALVQAFFPYSSIDLSSLSSLFMTPLPELSAEVVHLIEEGKIKARLDSQRNVHPFPKSILMSQVLVARPDNQRCFVYKASLRMATEYGKAAHGCLLNLKLAHANLQVKPNQTKDGKESS